MYDLNEKTALKVVFSFPSDIIDELLIYQQKPIFMNNDPMPNTQAYQERQPSFNNSDKSSSRPEFIAFCVLLATIVLAPLSFWPSPYISLDLVKTFIISIGTIVTAILFGFTAIKNKSIKLPPKSLVVTSLLIVLSILISSFASIHAGKSFFGQGFEVGTGSFIAILFLAGLAVFTAVTNRLNRAVVIYVGMAAVFVVLYVLQFLRLIFGPGFMSFSILNSLTASFIGGWYNFASLSIVAVILSFLAIFLLPLSRRTRIACWVLMVLSAISAILINDRRAWLMATLVFLGLTIRLTLAKARPEGGMFSSLSKRIVWIPAVLFLVSAAFFYKGSAIAGPAINGLKLGYSEMNLPWQLTLDVTASSIKNYPLFGVGPNHFSQAYLAYKPAGINQSDAWGTEFSSGFGFLPTLVSGQGLVGTILWILFFVFFGLAGAKALKNLPADPTKRFIVISSYASAVFLWLMTIVSVPSHTILFYAFVLSGIFAASAMVTGALPERSYAPAPGSRMHKFLPSIISLLILVSVVWGLVYLKNSIALSYFGGGIKQLTVVGNPDLADADFAKALRFGSSDIFWQARAEAEIAAARKLAATVTSATSASSSQAVLTQMADLINKAAAYAGNAVKYDPTNYYNYISQARVYEAASEIKMANGFENAVQAYTTAIRLNPGNPSIYLSLASLQAKQSKLDDGVKTLGAALQVKNNYLDAVFLLSQIYATKGDLPNAIIAAQVATQLNPTNSLLLFQLGILQYSSKNYQAAVDALSQAVKIQTDYANAKYFLGLAYARLNKTDEAISQFEDLAKTNPDNQEVALILANLKAGKSIFADAQPPVTTAPEKRASLPIKEKR